MVICIVSSAHNHSESVLLSVRSDGIWGLVHVCGRVSGLNMSRPLTTLLNVLHATVDGMNEVR
jgi:hypothetical protein